MSTETNISRSKSDDEIDLFELAAVLWQQKWLIIGITFVITLSAGAYAMLATPIYQSAATTMPPRTADIVPVNLGRDRAELDELDVDQAYSIFTRNLTSQRLRIWFYEAHYRPYLLEQGITGTRDSLLEQMNNVLVIRRPFPVDNPNNYAIELRLSDPELAAQFANSLIIETARRSLDDLEMNTRAQLENKRRELETTIDALRTSAKIQRFDRVVRLREALQIAETVGFDSPQVMRGRTAAEDDLTQIIDGSLLYMRGSRAIRAELELLEERKDDDPFIEDLRDLQRQVAMLDLIDPSPGSVNLFTLDSPAEVPDRPVEPNKVKIVIVGALLGAGLGGMLALARAAMRRREVEVQESSRLN